MLRTLGNQTWYHLASPSETDSLQLSRAYPPRSTRRSEASRHRTTFFLELWSDADHFGRVSFDAAGLMVATAHQKINYLRP